MNRSFLQNRAFSKKIHSSRSTYIAQRSPLFHFFEIFIWCYNFQEKQLHSSKVTTSPSSTLHRVIFHDSLLSIGTSIDWCKPRSPGFPLNRSAGRGWIVWRGSNLQSHWKLLETTSTTNHDMTFLKQPPFKMQHITTFLWNNEHHEMHFSITTPWSKLHPFGAPTKSTREGASSLFGGRPEGNPVI